MNEGISTPSHGEGGGPEAGGLPPQAVPSVKKFFLIEYLEEVRRGLRWMRAAPKPEQNIVNKVTVGLRKWSKLRKARIGMAVVVVIILAASGLFAGQAGSVALAPGLGPVPPGPTGHSQTWTFSGTVMENGNTSVSNNSDQGAFATMKATLSWSDESVGVLLQNQPDALGLQVTAPNGQSWTVNTSTTSPVTWPLPDAQRNPGVGKWTFTVLGGTMGDVTRPGVPGPCPRCSSDTSNAWTLKVEMAW